MLRKEVDREREKIDEVQVERKKLWGWRKVGGEQEGKVHVDTSREREREPETSEPMTAC